MSYLGDFDLSTTLFTKFTTVNASGIPTTLGDAPTYGFYQDANVTLFTAGVTVTNDFNSMTGLNHLQMSVTTSATGIVSGSNYQLVIATGSVSGVSLKGYVVGEFSIHKRSPLMPSTAGRTLIVSSTGGAAIDWANVGNPTTAVALTNTTISSAQQVDVNTIKTNPVVNAGTVTFPTTATLASTTNITAGIITTISGNVNGSVGSVTGSVGSVTGAVGSVTAGVTVTTNNDKTGYSTTDFTTALTESYRANGATTTPAQALYEILGHLGEQSISGTTKTVKKLDHATTAETFTLDSATTPSSITRAT